MHPFYSSLLFFLLLRLKPIKHTHTHRPSLKRATGAQRLARDSVRSREITINHETPAAECNFLQLMCRLCVFSESRQLVNERRVPRGLQVWPVDRTSSDHGYTTESTVTAATSAGTCHTTMLASLVHTTMLASPWNTRVHGLGMPQCFQNLEHTTKTEVTSILAITTGLF